VFCGGFGSVYYLGLREWGEWGESESLGLLGVALK